MLRPIFFSVWFGLELSSNNNLLCEQLNALEDEQKIEFSVKLVVMLAEDEKCNQLSL